MRFGVLAIILTLIVNACASPPAVPQATAVLTAPKNESVTLTVSAASDTTLAFQELGREFERVTGHKVTFNFGSTGQLAQQIEKGAPVDLFAAANISFIEDLEKLGLVIPDTKALYAIGRLTLWTRADSTLKIERIEDLTRPEISKIAIANPDHAPYGLAAKEALQKVGLWEPLQPKMVFGENVSQTLQYADTGNVDVALVALSLSVTSKGHWTLIADELHNPLNQALGVIKGTQHEAQARQFADFINGPQGRPIMVKYGFVLPGEATAK